MSVDAETIESLAMESESKAKAVFEQPIVKELSDYQIEVFAVMLCCFFFFCLFIFVWIA